MAYDVEDKVVQMRFDNREFDPNIDASIKSLEKLERSLQMANGTKGFENVEKSARNFNLNPAVTAVESLKNGFSTMEIVAITAISNITNKAMAMGNKLIQAFAIQPLTSGFGEYSEQMNSTQVILSNLSNDEVDFVLMHVVLHVALKHCYRGLDYNQQLFNIACDIVVNSNILYANGMNPDKISIDGNPLMHKTPKGDDGYLYTAEEVYQMLKDKINKSKGKGLEVFDDHSKWGELSKEEKEQLEQMVNEAIELSSNSVNSSNIPGDPTAKRAILKAHYSF